MAAPMAPVHVPPAPTAARGGGGGGKGLIFGLVGVGGLLLLALWAGRRKTWMRESPPARAERA